jgi:protein-disulfide isomerase
MTMINRRVLMAMAAALAAAPAWAQETAPADGTAATPAAPEVVDFSLGDPNAPVKIVEYASYTCPHCANFHETVFKPLKAEYIDTGKVHFTLREVYFDRYGLWAAMVARCGGDLRYFGISDILFSTQAEWAGSDDGTVVSENLRKIGLAAGLTQEQLDQCLNDAPMAEAMYARFMENMQADQVEGTPTLFVNGAKHGNMTFEDLKAIIETALAG